MNDNSRVRVFAAEVLWLLLVFAVTLSLASADLSAASQRDNRPVSVQAQERLERVVGHELRMLPYYSVFDNFEYQVKGYDVELMGQVTRPTLKTDAERVVKRIEGVEKVTNRIEVLPLSPNDDRIRRAVFQAIYSNSFLTRYALQAVPPVHIIVKNGHVTLVGVVATESESNVATIQANSVPGVFSVTNRLRPEKTGQKS
jgi:hyperosmotically inducible periplasmic protein